MENADPFQIMIKMGYLATQIARERGIETYDPDGWAACLDEAWERLRIPPFQNRQELARWCNDPRNMRRIR